MKKLIKISAALLLTVMFTINTQAQVRFSGGLELGYALEKNFGLMYGASFGGEYELNDNAGITGQIGYILNTTDFGSNFDKYSFNMLPIQFGYKHYFDSNTSGLYLHGQLGVHVLMSKIEYTFTTYDVDPQTLQLTPREEKVSQSDSQTNLSFAIGGGFMVSENIDLGLRYSHILADGGDFSYIGIRAAYNF